MSGRRDPEMQVFWASLPPKLKTALWEKDRRLVLSSDEVPLQMGHHSRLSMKTTPKFYLFTDVFAMAQGVTVTCFPLYAVWLEYMPVDGMFHSVQNMYSFKLVFPESEMELQCKELAHKSKWVVSIVDALGLALSIPQFVGARGDQNLDTKLELLRSREYMEHTFKSLPEYKDGAYKGQWKNAKPHGSGDFMQESTGRMYTGGFKDGKFHGEGEMHWFSDKDTRKKYIGEFRNGKLDGHGEMKYSNGDVYSGRWSQGVRCGFGRLEETSRKGSHYTGAWEGGRKNGYGIHEDKMKHERYLGMWVDDVRCGPGMFVSSAGTYCEATFASGVIASGNDGFVIDPDGRCFMGKLGPDLKLCGKGVLTLTNGAVIEGSFGGSWNKRIEISKATLEDKELQTDSSSSASAAMSELQIANLDSRIGNSTVQAFNKWKPIFKECEAALGFSGDAANDVFSAWNKLASDSFLNKRSSGVGGEGGGGGGGGKDKNAKSDAKPRRANSLTGMHGKTVKLPVRLIPLERARALTSAGLIRDDALRASIKMERSRTFASNSDPTSTTVSSPTETADRLQISRPINLEESMSCSYPSGMSYRISLSPYAPQADPSVRRHSEGKEGLEETVHISDPNATIQEYVDKAFNTPSHPLGMLMNRLEAVFHESYGGVGANKYLLPHAIAEMHSIIKRLHSIVRILFPFWSGRDVNVSQFGLTKLEGYSDPDDYVSIESGYELLHSLVFVRLFSTLITLYVLHHETSDKEYLKGLNGLKDMDDTKLVHFIRFPSHVCRKVIGSEADGTILKILDEASNTLRVINSLFTPGDFLEHFKTAFKHLSSIEQLSGDFLLPCVVFILVRANIPHLGAYLHFLTDFANTQAEDDYTLVTYEAAYNFIRRNSSSPPV